MSSEPSSPEPPSPDATATANDAPTLSGWGRLPRPGRERRSEDLARLTEDAVLTRGLGRSYGDSSLPPPGVLEVAASPLADRVLAFDADTGVLRAEAGLSLAELNRLFLRRGWFVPVSPGTQYVTLGGMVAADVHGKNHHVAGTFGAHVRSLRLRLASGEIVDCSRDERPDLFRATVGGMGLTGHILEVEVPLDPLPSPWILSESERVPDIETFVTRLKECGPDWPFTMGWIDCLSGGRALGRGILMRGRWARPEEAPDRPPPEKRRVSMPVVLPGWVLNPLSMRLFNELYFRKHPRRARRGIVHPESFFYPLDAILHWNRMYGPRGFTQYQCVLPDGPDDAATAARARRFLELLTARGGASFLCVIKDCGPEGEGVLSFPRPGISVALDIPVRDGTRELVDALDELVIAEGGRVYLAKDAFTRPESFRAMEPRLEEFERLRRRFDPEGRLASAQSVRLFGDRPPFGPAAAAADSDSAPDPDSDSDLDLDPAHRSTAGRAP